MSRLPRTTALAALFLSLAAACGSGEAEGESARAEPREAAAEASGDDSGSGARERGAAVYRAQNCSNCHGEAGEGGAFAPPLTGLAEHWTRAELVRYLRDPRALPEKSPRLVALEAEWPRLMPPYSNLSEDERGALADWMLSAD